MQNKHLHIICLDVPLPLNYGGAFEMFCKLAPLQKAGIRIHLHCFEYGRPQQALLNNYCEEVHYYPRQTGIRGFSPNIPYIVQSRYNKALLERLLLDDHPILMEGIHCTWLLNDERFRDRKLIVRLHNIEHEYYHHLAKAERSPFKKWYYTRESHLLKKYEASIAAKAKFFALTEKDAAGFKQQFNADVTFVPAFVPWNEVTTMPGSGTYCLYHGNLSVAENEKVAAWLLQNVDVELIIAGKDPSPSLKQLSEKFKNARLIANPDELQMQDLIRHAHINILPAFSSTGIKFKLLHALFEGRHCLVNREMVEGTGLDECCIISSDAEEMKMHINSLKAQPFTQEMLHKRIAILQRVFDNNENARKLTGWIW